MSDLVTVMFAIVIVLLVVIIATQPKQKTKRYYVKWHRCNYCGNDDKVFVEY